MPGMARKRMRLDFFFLVFRRRRFFSLSSVKAAKYIVSDCAIHSYSHCGSRINLYLRYFRKKKKRKSTNAIRF